MRLRLLTPAVLVAAAALVAVSAPTVANAATLTGSNAELAQVDAGSATRVIPITGQGAVDDVTITIDFLKTDGSCAAPQPGDAFHGETRFALASPTGTSIALVSNGTYSGGTATGVVSVTFDDAAATTVGGGAPVSGTFRPVQSLAAFDGELAAGDWILTVADSTVADPLCYYKATLTVETGVPVLSDATLANARLDAPYTTAIVADEGDAPITYALAGGSTLPEGLALAADGTLSGAPTEHGDFTFDLVASNAEGSSEPATFSLRVEAPATLVGPTTATAQIGVPFSYVPEFEDGTPSTGVGVAGLPAWLVVDETNGALSGTPTGALGDVTLTYAADNGVVPAPELTVTLSIVAGPAVTLALSPETATVGAGGSQTFEVTGVDVEGNAADLSAAELTSSVATDVVDDRTVTFATPGARTITATLGDLADTATVEVVAAAAPAPSAPAPSAPAPSAPVNAAPALPQTGAGVAGWLAAVAALLVAAGAVVRRATRA